MRPLHRYLLARALWILGLQAQGVAVGWQIYDRTGSALDLGLVGLVQFLPVFLLWPWGGEAADRYDRRLLNIATAGLHASVAAGLALLDLPVAGALSLLALGAAGRAFAGPSLQSTLPSLVTVDEFPRAVALNSTMFQLGATLGPALGGLLYAWAGPRGAFGVAAALIALGAAVLATLPSARPAARPQGDHVSARRRIAEGLAYVRNKPILLGALSLDLVAVLLGGATALLPVYARDVLQGGPALLGVLRAAPAVGAGLVAATIAFRPIRRRAGPRMLWAVGLYGAATVAFGLSREVWLAVLALGLLGAADEVSVVVRQTIVQLGTPDALRGRVSSINLVFISVSNELGQLESGLLAAAVGAVPAVVLGGLGAILAAAGFAWRFPELRRIDRLTSSELV